MQINVSQKVLTRAAELAGGDTQKAKHWYFEFPLPELDGDTAAVAVGKGREADVLLLLDMYDAGATG